MRKLISYLCIGATDFLVNIVGGTFIVVSIMLPIVSVGAILFRGATEKLIIDGQFQAGWEVFVLLVYFVLACIVRGKHLAEY